MFEKLTDRMEESDWITVLVRGALIALPTVVITVLVACEYLKRMP